MYCSKCGVQNSDEATQCANCGSILVEPSQQAVAEGIPVVPFEPKTSRLAIAAFVTGILTVFCVTWPICGPLAIIFGIIAMVKISQSNGQLKGIGLAVTGLVIPIVMILVIMLAIMMPALSKTKMTALRVVCGTNMKGLSTAMIVYMNDYDDQYPTPEQWCDLLIEEADAAPKSFQCPLVPEGSFSYAINENLYKIEPGKLPPAQVVVLFEADLGRNGVGGSEDLILRHSQNQRVGCNIGFADGHVEFVTEDRIAELQWMAE